jgi:hypothetical protein
VRRDLQQDRATPGALNGLSLGSSSVSRPTNERRQQPILKRTTTVKKTTTVPVQGGTTKQKAQALAEKAIRELSHDPEALQLVVQLVEALAARSRGSRR